MNPAQDRPFDEIILQAQRLLETWDRLGRAHMMIGAGCSCGIGGVVVALEDFEQDIADYLQAEAERLDRQDVLNVLGGTGARRRVVEHFQASHRPCSAHRVWISRSGRRVFPAGTPRANFALI